MPTAFELLKQKNPGQAISNPATDKTLQEGVQAKEFLAKPWYKQIFTKQVAKEVPSAVAETTIGTPAKFIASTAEVPETLIKGQATQRTYNVPGLKPFQSFQSEAENRIPGIVSGEQPLINALIPFAQVPLAGMETATLGKGAFEAGKIGISFLAKRKAETALKDALSITSPKTTGQAGVDIAKKAGKEGGTKVKGVLKRVVLEPSAKDRQIAESVKDIVSKNKTYTENIINTNKAIENNSNQVLRPYLAEHSRPLTETDVQSLLNQIDSVKAGSLTKANPVLKNTFDSVKNNFKDTIIAKAKDDESLYNTRILMDKIISRETKGKAFEQISSANDAILEIRRKINKFISNRMPNPEIVDNALEYEHNLYSAINRMALSAQKEIGTIGLQRFLKAYPLIRTAIKAGGWFGLGYGVSRLFGTGSIGQSSPE